MQNLVSKKDVAARLGYHPVSLMRLVRQGLFPKPIVLASNKCAFLETEVAAWIDQKAAEREQVAA
ncbi:MAG: AlpA family phage regulatory protein [Tistlia sp.]|uniref:helix-turn-helix transcriptional regulator n=1 Tax=Tistlia sp. TaxID=3057121 RepID=UPI0034A56CE0